MKVLRQSENLTKRDIVILTTGSTVAVKDEVGKTFTVDSYIQYEEDEKVILVFRDSNGLVRGTNSKTFQDKFLKIVDIMEGDTEPLSFKIINGTTKAGRIFVSCDMI